MKTKISVSIPPALLKKLEEALDKYKKEKGWDRSELICFALEELLLKEPLKKK